jgi:hypothetical protein
LSARAANLTDLRVRALYENLREDDCERTRDSSRIQPIIAKQELGDSANSVKACAAAKILADGGR